MEITVLGSGTFIPEINRKSSGYLMESGGEKLIFDFGRGTIENLLRLGVNLYVINKIFISHMHTDHSSELASFIQLILDASEKRKLKDKYFVYGPKGIKKDIKNMLKTFHMDKHKHLDRIEIKEIKKTVKIDNIKIKSFKVKHGNIPSIAYKLEFKDKAVCYSGDSSYCKGLKKACRNVDIAIIEATAPKKWKMKNHLDGEEVGKLSKENNIKELVVTHIAKPYLSKVEKDIKKYYKGKIKIAKDLMKITI